MKHLLLFTFLFLSGMVLSSQNIFFPSKEGTKLTYENYDSKGKSLGKITYIIKEVKRMGDDMDITYGFEMTDDKEKQVMVDEITVQKLGDQMLFDMSGFLNKAAFPQQEGSASMMEVTGNHMEIPLVPVPGMSLPDANIQISMKAGFINLKMSSNVKNRKVEAIEEISVKGRNFKTFKISNEVSSNMLGVKVNTTGYEWYAYNIGVVKSESYNKKGKLESRMELIDIQE